jgi:hypothetical protein
MLLTNLAMYHENLSLAPTFPIMDVNGEAFYHGLSTGVEWTW